jgi:transposase-like protein
MKKQTLVTDHRNIRRSLAQWQQIMATYESSDLSQQAFCEQKGLAPSSFSKWRRQLKDEKVTQKEPLTKSMFMALPLQGMLPTQPLWDIEVELGNGIALRLRRV